MKIFLVNFWQTVGSTGGTEKVLCNMANELSERGAQITVVCCDNENGLPFFPLSQKVNFINLNGSGRDLKVSIPIKIQREFLRLIGLLDKYKMLIWLNSHYQQILEELSNLINVEKPDIIIAFDPNSIMVLKYLLKNNSPTIAMLHLDCKLFFNEKMDNILLNSFKNVNCIQVLNKSNIEIVRQYCPDIDVRYIPNVVEMSLIKKNYDKCYNKIITVSRIEELGKRPHLLIKAVNKIYKEYYEWTLEVVGGTYTTSHEKYKTKILKFIEENNLHNKVCLTGVTDKVEIKLQKADIFAFPSAHEGFPLALTEAMAIGLPAIGYKTCAGVNELIIDGYNGFLCEDGIDDFAEKLKILMQDAELRKKMGQNARESMKQFAPKKIWDEWEDLINKVVEESKK